MSRSNSEDNDEAEVHEIKPEQFKKFIKRIQNIDTAARELASDRAHVYLEAKNAGYDTKAMKRVITALKIDPETRAASDAVYNSYAAVLGLEGTPLGDAAVIGSGGNAVTDDPDAEQRRKATIERFGKGKKRSKKA